MTTNSPAGASLVTVRGTELLASDSRELYRQKLARITLDSMVQFVGLLDAQGTVLEINQVALDAVGIALADVEGQPFWTTFWWQVSDEINATLRDSIRRAAQGEFVRWDAEIYGRAGGKETIIIDASLMPVKDDQGNVVFIAAEGRDITEKKAYEREIARQREELAKLDELKTQFFANISHEFRTPLTLMLGPLESVLSQNSISSETRNDIETARRNSLRLLKLVNSLLDFSRIEAGRVRATYVPVDLSALTADLASNFRSALHAAGLQLEVDCAPLPQPVHVDRDMWEKIVLNLLSNAFKFTFEGRIAVTMQAKDNQAILTVADTGTGIPEGELPHIFERFYRVEGARGRTYEGTGIGLSLIQELVRLHGGAIDVASQVGRGTTFTIVIPFGTSHLPQGHLAATSPNMASTAVRAEAYTEEARTWLATERLANPSKETPNASFDPLSERSHVLLADDNADMREHVSRILGNGYEVTAVTNGIEALKAARSRKPDLILTDVMMPVLDGFGLLREIRADADLQDVPVIVISARAGEEARTDGISAGADDYLTKPFNAKELVARVETTLALQRTRAAARADISKSEERFRAFVTATSDVVYQMSPDWTEMRHLRGRNFVADTLAPSSHWLEQYLHPEDQPGVLAAIRHAIETKSPFELEHRVIRVDGSLGWTFSRAVPILTPAGEIVEWFGAARDITERKHADEAFAKLTADADQQRRLYLTILSSTPDFVYVFDRNERFTYVNQALLSAWGKTWEESIGKTCLELGYEPWHAEMHGREIAEVIATRRPIRGEVPFTASGTGGRRIYDYIFVPVFGANGEVEAVAGTTRDVTDRKRGEEQLRRANEDLEQFAYTATHDLQEPLRGVRIYSELLERRYAAKFDGQALEFLNFVRGGATRMEMLVRDLLSYTQVDKLESPTELASASDCLEAALANLTGILSESNGHVAADPLPTLHIHHLHLQQLFQNLIGNALKYHHPDRKPEIRISCRKKEPYWLFSVADNGIGIDPEYKERIFGLFKRLHTSDEYSGTGIGLAICQRIVERYGGRIWVESEPGQGSAFHFTLPA